MSLGIIPYQPFAFGVEENCTLPCSGWIQLIDINEDVTSFQFSYGACGNTNSVLSNGDFSELDTDWGTINPFTFTGNSAISPVNSSGLIFHSIIGAANLFYELSFTLVINNGAVILSSNLGVIETYTTTGVYKVVINSESMTTLSWLFDGESVGSIANVTLIPIDNELRIGLFDLEDNFLQYVTDNGGTFTAGFLTFNIDWSEQSIVAGCYKIAVYDPCVCSQFGFAGDVLTDEYQFVVSVGTWANVDISLGSMKILNSGVSAVTVLRKDALCVGVQYEINYTLSGMVGGDSLRIKAGFDNGTLRTADGTYTDFLTPTASNDQPQDLRFVFGVPDGLHLVTLSDFSIEAVVPIPTFYSVPFKLGELCFCSVKIEICGNENQYNMGFEGTGFKPAIRLEGTFRGNGHPSTKVSYETAQGKKIVPYSRLRKGYSLRFGAPEYVHDAAALWGGIDNIYIDGVLMASEDSEPPTPSAEDEVDYSTVTWSFSRKTELTQKKTKISGHDIGCTTSGYGVSFIGTGSDGFGDDTSGGTGVIFTGSRRAEALNGYILTYNS